MKINELLNTPPSKYDTRPEGKNKISSFVTPKGQKVEVAIQYDEDVENTLQVSFTVDGEYGITGKGEIGLIFSTVLDVIKKTMNKYPNMDISFSSEDFSRTNFYMRLLDKYLKPPYTYKHEERDTASHFVDVFLISR